MQNRTIDLGTPGGGWTIMRTAENAVESLALIRRTFIEVRAVTFEFNGTPVTVGTDDTPHEVFQQWHRNREMQQELAREAAKERDAEQARLYALGVQHVNREGDTTI